MNEKRPVRVALVHDWLIHIRGGEKVLEALYELFPQATLFTLFCDRKRLSPRFKSARIKTSFLQYVPGIKKFYRWVLPILPWVIRTLDLRGFDLIISSSHCVAKGCKVPLGAFHICYCHTPMRYAWEMREIYFGHYPSWIRRVINFFLGRIERWDVESNRSVHLFIANSENTRRRIQEYYGRDAVVIHPPAETRFFRADSARRSEDYFLLVSALVPYKRVDLAIQAFNKVGYPLIVIGEGPLQGKLIRMAKSNIRFLDWQPNQDLKSYYQNCRALIFPGLEDFGIVPVEAQAAGRPVIGYGRGGLLETVIESVTGIFFSEQTEEALIDAVHRFESMSFDSEAIRRHAEAFHELAFKEKITRLTEAPLDQLTEERVFDSFKKLSGSQT